MKIDIIMPAYKGFDMIDKAIASVAMQKLDEGDSIKLTIVNDCSPDGDYHAVAKYWAEQIDISVVDKKINAGCGQARQTGMDVTDGEAFMFLDVDDVLGSPFAVRTLAREFKNGYDMVMGIFIEETSKGSIIQHGANFVWCHGKMYRRSFVDAHDLRFNLTRGNEDVGFHSVFSNLTENVLYVPQVVYVWENYKDSLVRSDSNDYSCGTGWYDFIENMAWAAEEMELRRIDPQKIADFCGKVLARLYWQYNEAYRVLPGNDHKAWDRIQDFCLRAVKPRVLDGTLDFEKIRKAYETMAVQEPNPLICSITFKDFLEKAGYTVGENL